MLAYRHQVHLVGKKDSGKKQFVQTFARRLKTKVETTIDGNPKIRDLNYELTFYYHDDIQTLPAPKDKIITILLHEQKEINTKRMRIRIVF